MRDSKTGESTMVDFGHVGDVVASDPQLLTLLANDIDPFNHVNNTTYWHAVEECLADRPELRRAPYRAVVEHLGPIYARDHVRLRTDGDETSLSVWFLVGSEVRAVARVEMLPREKV